MNAKIKFILLFILIFGTSLSGNDQEEFRWKIGEELTYKVKWSFVRLGTVTLQICDTLQMDSQKVYQTKLFIDSNPVLFFVNMHSVFESYIDESFYPHLFLAVEKIDGVKYDTQYRFDYDRKMIDVKMTDVKDTTRIIQKSIPFDQKVQDGMSLIFYARGNLSIVKKHNLIAFAEGEKGKLVLNTKGDGKEIGIDALEHKLPSYEVDGNADFKAIAGFTGNYRGWFSKDSGRLPLKAEMKVFIGHISLELESWQNWEPPVELN